MTIHVTKQYTRSLCIYPVLCAMLLRVSSFAQSPITYSTIVDEVEKRVPEAELIKRIETQKVDFYLKPSDSVDLRFKGASDQILHVIEANRKISKLTITFDGWKPFGEIAIAPWNKNQTVFCKGSCNAYPGLTTLKTFKLDNRRTLVVKMEDIESSNFTDQDKMLKVFALDSNKTLCCITDSLLAPEDKEFVVKKGGEIRYRIPEAMIIGGGLTKLGFQFGPGEYNTFKVSAWFE